MFKPLPKCHREQEHSMTNTHLTEPLSELPIPNYLTVTSTVRTAFPKALAHHYHL